MNAWLGPFTVTAQDPAWAGVLDTCFELAGGKIWSLQTAPSSTPEKIFIYLWNTPGAVPTQWTCFNGIALPGWV